MTDDRMALMEALQKADDGNFLRSLAETVLQILMEADVEGRIAARWLPPARISRPWPQRRFLVKHPTWEPSALAAHARICPGGAG